MKDEPQNVSVLPLKGGEIIPSSKSMARDAAGLRRLLVKTLRGFSRGEVSVQEAHHVGILSKRTLEAMKMEYLAGPRISYEADTIDADADED